jgi:hypothetical protein
MGGLETGEGKEHVIVLEHVGQVGEWLDLDFVSVGVEVGGKK